jgi:hypothetical protein
MDQGGSPGSSSSSSSSSSSDLDRLSHPWQTLKAAFSNNPDTANAATKPTGSAAGSDNGASKLGQGWKAAGYADGGMIKNKRTLADVPFRNEDDEDDSEEKQHQPEPHRMTGVHWAPDKNKPGISNMGSSIRVGENWSPKDTVKMRTNESKKINPKLQGLAEGGEVKDGMEDMDMDYENEAHEAIGKELMDALHKKDHKAIMGCIEAAVLNCMNKKHEGEDD